MNNNLIKLFNGKVITLSGIINNGSVIINGSKIDYVGDKNIEVNNALEIDVKGQYISPGFIDIHVHGGGGHDFMDCTELAFLEIAKTHAKFGTTGMLPTTLSSSKEEIIESLSVYETAKNKNIDGAQFLGMHLEGPYFAMNQRGAQDPKYIRNPDPNEYMEILERFNCVKRWSAAPELPGALDFAKYCLSKNILPALAHTDAIYEEVLLGFENGYTLATHLYSGMNGVVRRNAYRFAGAVESAFLIDKMDVEIIADGIHLPEPLLKLIYRIKGSETTALITDAMRAAGIPEGKSRLGSLKNGIDVIVENGVAKLPDRSSFAGSIATTDQLIRTMVNIAQVPLIEAIKMITATPARILGLSQNKGDLQVGKDADIVVFDKDININHTIVNGKIIYKNIN